MPTSIGIRETTGTRRSSRCTSTPKRLATPTGRTPSATTRVTHSRALVDATVVRASFGTSGGAAFGISYLFERRSFKLWLINTGYHTLQITAFGAIFGMMN